jgi:NADH-quinone oxidoreductase subunit K
MNATLPHFLIISAALFSVGLLAVLSRRTAIFILIGIEMMLGFCVWVQVVGVSAPSFIAGERIDGNFRDC